MIKTKKYKDLVEYVNDQYYDLLFSKAKSFIFYNSNIDFSSEYIPSPFYKELTEVCITSLYTESRNGDNIILNCTGYAEVGIKGHAYGKRHNDVEEDSKRIWLNIRIRAVFTDKFIKVYIGNDDICLSDEKNGFKLKGSATKSFVPYISEKDLDFYAEQFLEKYYKEALTTPMPLPIDKVISAMGLKVKRAYFKDNIFGKIYFVDKKYKDKNGNTKVLTAGTILYDDGSSFIDGVGSTNNTIIHECVHWEHHKKFFDLQHLLDGSVSGIECTTVDSDVLNSKNNTEEFKWMEWQANALAPRILMPAKMILQKYEELKEAIALNGEQNLSVVYKTAVDQLASFFQVTRTSAKIRLIQLGVTEVIGVHDYIDNYSVKTYVSSYKTDSSESFISGTVDTLVSMAFNKEVRDAVNSSKLIYVNGFLVVNSEKYVHRNELTKAFELTDYALGHIDECCIVFDVEKKFKNGFDDKYYSMCYLCRAEKSSSYLERKLNVKKEHNRHILELAEETSLVSRDTQEALNLVENMPSDFKQCFKYLYDESEYDGFKTMSRDCGISDKTLANYYYGKSEPSSLKQMLAIISCWYFHPLVVHKFLSTKNYNIKDSLKEADLMYCHLINNWRGKGNQFWNEFLISYGLTEAIIPDSAELSDYIIEG